MLVDTFNNILKYHNFFNIKPVVLEVFDLYQNVHQDFSLFPPTNHPMTSYSNSVFWKGHNA